MAMSVAKGTKLTVNTKAVGHLTKIGSPSIKRDSVECTALDTKDNFKEFMDTFAEGGEVSLSGWLDFADEGQKEVINAVDSGDTVTCVITFPKAIGAKWEFGGNVTAFSTSAETAGMVSFEATVKVSGKPSLKADSDV